MRSHQALFAICAVLAPVALACAEQTQQPSNTHTAAGPPAPLPPCPSDDVCLDLEERRAKCEAGPAAACDAFATAFERLLPECRPTGSERRVADGSSGCVDVEVGGHRVYDAALATLLQTAERRPGRARGLFESERFRATLSGEYAESYVPRSLNMSRASRGLPPIDWEEDIGLSATASSTLPAQSGNRYDPALAVVAGRGR